MSDTRLMMRKRGSEGGHENMRQSRKNHIDNNHSHKESKHNVGVESFLQIYVRKPSIFHEYCSKSVKTVHIHECNPFIPMLLQCSLHVPSLQALHILSIFCFKPICYPCLISSIPKHVPGACISYFLYPSHRHDSKASCSVTCRNPPLLKTCFFSSMQMYCDQCNSLLDLRSRILRK